MSPEEVEKIVQTINEKLTMAFKKELSKHGLEKLLPHCFAVFDSDRRAKKYGYHVFFQLEPKLAKNEFWEETEQGRKLVSIDQKTGEKSFIISNLYEGEAIFRAGQGFHPDESVVITVPLNRRKMKSTARRKNCMVSEHWKDAFLIERNKN